jgi:serine phosphatase RsbU (regulator of sigma subunit)
MTEITTQQTLAWISNQGAPPVLQQATAGRWRLQDCPPAELSGEAFETMCVAVVDAACEARETILAALQRSDVTAVVLGDGPAASASLAVSAPADVEASELAGMLRAAEAMGASVREARHRAVEAVRSADNLDEEMKLASKLQQDFLPRRLPTVGDIRFAVLYRPASWVSGDIYDVTRLDETHVGFYVADAVGHGMPAALLTMFIKEAMQTKRISGHSYELIPPAEALAALNADLCRQRLSMCEFCTALYGIMDCTTGEFTMSRAGHPAPIHINPQGCRHALNLAGPLLGVLDDAEYDSQTFNLAPGERLVLYSDGLEDALCGKGATDLSPMLELFAARQAQPREKLIMQISERLDELNCEDDVTLLLVERE